MVMRCQSKKNGKLKVDYLIGHTKRQFQTAKFIRGQFQTGILKQTNILQVVMFQNVLMNLKQIFLFFSMSFLMFVCPFNFKNNLCVFPIPYTCLYVISYKCKYVLFHLNILRLLQEINILFFTLF